MNTKILIYSTILLLFNYNISFAQQKQNIIITGGQPFNIEFANAGKVCQFANKKSQYLCSVTPNKTSVEAIKMINNHKVDFAIVQSDWVIHAQNATSRFINKQKNNNIRKVFVFNQKSVLIAVNQESNIQNIKQLKHKIIDVGFEKTYRYIVAKAILNTARIKDKSIKKMAFKQKNTINKLCENQIDAGIIIISTPNEYINKIANKCKLRFLSIPNKFLAKLQKKLNGFSKINININDKNIETIGLYNILITNKNTDNTKVKHIFNSINNNIENLKKYSIFSNIPYNNVLKQIKKHEAIQ